MTKHKNLINDIVRIDVLEEEIEYFERYNDKVMKFLSIKLKKLPKEDSQLKNNK
mgnify:CR=1 FL=1